MIKEFSYTFSELELVPDYIAELLGFNQNNVPDPFPELIEKALKEAPNLCNAKAGFKVLDHCKIDQKEQKIVIENQIFSPGKIIITQLKNASSIAIFICTAGNEISVRSKQLADKGDQLFSYILDVTGSLITEKIHDKMKLELEKYITKSGLTISDSFSPGYCDWNVSEQEKLFALLPKDFCGIKLSESFLMSPVKSVSGFIGIGKTMEHKGYQCHWCNDTNCFYGKIKRQKKN